MQKITDKSDYPMTRTQSMKHRVSRHPFSRTRAPLDEILTAQALIAERNRQAHVTALMAEVDPFGDATVRDLIGTEVKSA